MTTSTSYDAIDGVAAPSHPSGIDSSIIRKVVSRRGHLHAFAAISSARTALVVVDLTRASVEGDETCRRVVAPVNAVATALRRAGGTVAWVTPAPRSLSGDNVAAIHGADRIAHFQRNSDPLSPDGQLWHGLDVKPGDIHVQKSGYSAFFPGKCDLHERLQAQGTDTLLVAGTVTNVCCESSVRDAVELGYRVVMISDANAGHAYGLHEASLATIYRCFGDVRPSTEVLELIAGAGDRP